MCWSLKFCSRAVSPTSSGRPVTGKHSLRSSLYTSPQPRQGLSLYRTVNVASSGSSADDPPAITLYSPLGLVQRFAATSQIDSYIGSTSIVTVLLSPGASSTFLYAISRFHGSSALCGSAAYTSATSAPARAPAFFTVSVTVSPSLPTFRLE